MKRFFLLLLVVFITVASFGCGSKTELPPLEGELTDLAEAFFACLVAEDYAGAVAYFDSAMKKAMPAAKLKETWENLQSQAGPYLREAGKREDTIEGYDVVYITGVFQAAQIDIRLVFNQAKRITGLWFLSAEDGKSYTPPAYSDKNKFTDQSVVVGAPGWELPGTLTVPAGPGPYPAVVLVHGSGPNDRDESIGPNKPFRDLAEGLATRGIAVLRYEKRTKEHAARMAKEEALTVWEETINDALSAVTAIKSNDLIDPSRIYVLGHSLGGMLAPRIGAGVQGLAGLVVLAGPGRPLEDLVSEQYNYLANLDGFISAAEEAELMRLEAQSARVKDAGLSEKTTSSDLPLGLPASYWLDLRDYKAPQAAKELTLPLMVLQGERDYQVTMEDFAVWHEVLSARPDVTCKSYPSLNHLFMEGEGLSTPGEYLLLSHVAEEVIEDIAGWLSAK